MSRNISPCGRCVFDDDADNRRAWTPDCERGDTCLEVYVIRGIAVIIIVIAHLTSVIIRLQIKNTLARQVSLDTENQMHLPPHLQQ
jgi:hypothetical protein